MKCILGGLTRHLDVLSPYYTKILISCPILSAGQFFRDGVEIDVDAQLLHVPGHSPVPVEQRDLWKFMSKSLIGDRQCWTSAYPSSQGAGIVAGTYQDYIVDDLLAIGQ